MLFSVVKKKHRINLEQKVEFTTNLLNSANPESNKLVIYVFVKATCSLFETVYSITTPFCSIMLAYIAVSPVAIIAYAFLASS